MSTAKWVLIASMGLYLLAPAPAEANKNFLSAEAVVVGQAAALPSGPQDAQWSDVSASVVWVAAQRTVLMIDADANTHRKDPAKRVEVRALSAQGKVAVHLSWPDATMDYAAFGETRSFGDSVALEMPLEFGAGKRLPYVGMGDPQSHVLIHMQRAVIGNELGLKTQRKGTYVGAGFGSLTRAETDWVSMQMQYDPATRSWSAQFTRALTPKEHSIERPLVPFAIAVWDGHKHQRGGNKMLSRWHVLHRPELKAEPDYLKDLSYGYNADDRGVAAAGKPLVDAICAACHRFADKMVAPPQLAPELSNIGVISTPAYLRDSVTKPSQIIVPVLNLNRHYSKSADRDKFGAHANDMTYQWFTPGPDGAHASRMPPFAFPPDQIANIVAYLRTLGAPAQSEAAGVQK